MITEQLTIFDAPDAEDWQQRLAAFKSAGTTVTQCKAVTKPANNQKLAEKLSSMADLMQVQIDDKFRDRQTNTAKRMAQAAHARADGERLKRTQQAMRALARLHAAGECPDSLAHLKSKKAINELMAAKMDQVQNGYHSYYIDSGEPREDATPEAIELWAMLKGKTDEEIHAEKIDEMVRNLQFSKIPGYFPTPKPVIDLMLDYADIGAVDLVLEPSAGSGAIIDGIREECGDTPTIVAYEINQTLCEILQAKGFDARPIDFMDSDCTALFDRVVMNPPFESGQDVKHVLHAFSRLKQGGRLVSVMSPSPFFRTNKASVAFQQWIEQTGAEVIDLPEGSFKESGTGVSTKLVIVDKE